MSASDLTSVIGRKTTLEVGEVSKLVLDGFQGLRRLSAAVAEQVSDAPSRPRFDGV